MNLLHVVPTYLPATRYGGPIHSVHGLCRALAARGHRVSVYTTSVNGPSDSDVPLGVPVDMDGVKVTYFRSSFMRRLYWSGPLAAALMRDVPRFDLVHLHSVFLWPTLAAARVSRRAGVPYVVSPRGMLVRDLIRERSSLAKRAWIALFERRTLRHSTAIHCTSALERDELLALGLAASDAVQVIPNGATVVADEPARGPAPALDGRPVVLFIGRINWKKGLERLIGAAAHLPDARLVLAGNDEEQYTPQLAALAARLGVAERVEFIGEVRGVTKLQWIDAARVLVLPSHSENFGNVVLEALARACPVVVTREVGLADAVAAAGAGLVAVGEPAALARAIRRLLDDAALRAACGAAGRQLVARDYSWAGVATLMTALYEAARA